MAETKRTTSEIIELLRARYPGESHVTLFEVRDAAGFDAQRSCDCLSIGTWPSRGLTLRGFEIKVSRSDWLREYRNPEKADGFAPYCDEWYVVAGDSKIVQSDELPETWGLIVAKGSRLECVKAAPKNPSPLAVDRGLLVALLKRAKEQSASKAAIENAHKQGVAQGKALAESEMRLEGGNRQQLLEEIATLRANIKEFADASGIDMYTFRYHDPKRLGDAVRTVLNGGLTGMANRARQMRADAERVVESLRMVEKSALEAQP